MATKKRKSPGGGAVGRPRMYKDDAEKVRLYKEKHGLQRIGIECKPDAPINKDTLQKAADALGTSLAGLMLQAVGNYILDKLGADWLEAARHGGEVPAVEMVSADDAATCESHSSFLDTVNSIIVGDVPAREFFDALDDEQKRAFHHESLLLGKPLAEMLDGVEMMREKRIAGKE